MAQRQTKPRRSKSSAPPMNAELRYSTPPRSMARSPTRNSSAGALIGLQFVVIALLADMPTGRGEAKAGGIFATPSVVHFGVVLLLAAIVSAPWEGIATVAVLWGLVGVCGIVSAVVGVSERKPPTGLCSRTGCFMFCFRLRPTQSWSWWKA